MLPPGYGGDLLACKHVGPVSRTSAGETTDTPTTAPAQLTPAQAWQLCLPLLNSRTTIRLGLPRKGGIAYERRHARRVADHADAPPRQPAAVHVFDTQGTTRFLPLDLDAHDGTPEQIAAVEDDLATLTALLDEAGMVHLADRAHGGAHVYVLLADPMSADDARTLCTALARRLPTLDIAPASNASDGLLTIPGSAHRRGGHRELVTDADTARAIVSGPHSPRQAVYRLRMALADELRALATEDAQRAAEARESARQTGAASTLELVTDEDMQAVQQRGLGKSMSTKAHDLAMTGDWRAHGYPSASEARRVVLMSAVAVGMTEADVRARMLRGTWPGLRSLFDTKGLHRLHDEYTRAAEEITRRERIKATSPATRENNGDTSDTSAKTHSGGGGNTLTLEDTYGQIRTWMTLVALHASQEVRGARSWDRQMMLRSLGKAASLTGSTITAMGVRWHAVSTAEGRTEAAAALRALAAENDPWIELVRAARGIDADHYRLRIPDRYANEIEGLRWQRGLTHAVRPAFAVLGKPTGLFFEAVEQGHTTRARIALRTGLSAESYRDARDTALAYGLVRGNDRDGYEVAASDADLEELGQALGAYAARTAQIQQHRRERRAFWAKLAALSARGPRYLRDLDDNTEEIDALRAQMILDSLDPPPLRAVS